MRGSTEKTRTPTFQINEFGKPDIPNRKLELSMIPCSRSEWGVICRFALTYDGYDHRRGFDACADVANPARARYKTDRTLPESLTDLRTCLFFEQRKCHHFGWAPEGSRPEVHLRPGPCHPKESGRPVITRGGLAGHAIDSVRPETGDETWLQA